MRVYVCACVRACVRVCVCVCVRACVRAWTELCLSILPERGVMNNVVWGRTRPVVRRTEEEEQRAEKLLTDTTCVLAP